MLTKENLALLEKKEDNGPSIEGFVVDEDAKSVCSSVMTKDYRKKYSNQPGIIQPSHEEIQNAKDHGINVPHKNKGAGGHRRP
eukprot:UN09852